MTLRPFLALLLASSALATPAAAQDDKRLGDLQRQVRELRAIVFQGRDTGQPVEVKPVGPDPQVVALQAKVDDLAAAQRTLVGQNEVMSHDLDEARRTAEQLKAEASAYRGAADARIARLEAQLAGQVAPTPPADTAAAPPLPPPAPTAAGGSNGRPPPSRRAAELTARTQAGDTSRFGDPAPAPAAAAPTAGDGFDQAYQRLVDADYAGAQTGFEGFLARSPTSPKAPEARYYIAQSLYVRENYGLAARAYSEALKGWPKSKWAPDATVKLAISLAALDRGAQACAALSEFSRRYGAVAPAAVKARAATARAHSACTAG